MGGFLVQKGSAQDREGLDRKGSKRCGRLSHPGFAAAGIPTPSEFDRLNQQPAPRFAGYAFGCSQASASSILEAAANKEERAGDHRREFRRERRLSWFISGS